jgi:hypothetical protein
MKDLTPPSDPVRVLAAAANSEQHAACSSPLPSHQIRFNRNSGVNFTSAPASTVK